MRFRMSTVTMLSGLYAGPRMAPNVICTVLQRLRVCLGLDIVALSAYKYVNEYVCVYILQTICRKVLKLSGAI